MTSFLFGSDPEQNIIACYQLNEKTIRVYKKINNIVSYEDREFYPFFFISDISLLEEFNPQPLKKKLQGNNYYKYLCVFQNWNDLKNAGVHIRASRPFKWTKPLHYIHRDHKKLIIIDGRVAFTGGLNIANEYRGFHRLRKIKGWRDTGIFLEGPIADTLLGIFKKSWEIWKGEPLNFQTETILFDDGIPVIPIFASSSKSRKKMRKLLYYSISNSKESIYLTTAYFTPSIRMLNVLMDAINKGVSVNLLLPGRSDVLSAHYAGRAFFTTLLKAGVRIYNYKGEMLHAKTSVFDCNWSIIGSANLDFQSMRRNDEGNVGILDNNFGNKMIDVFNEDLKNSEEIILENWLKRPFVEKLKESFFVLFRKRL